MWLMGLLLIQDYIRWETILPIIFFIGLIAWFLIKQHLEDKDIY